MNYNPFFNLSKKTMVFVACGLNHKTAPLYVREKVAFSGEDIFLTRLISLPEIHEAAILSTCNRTEIYCETKEPKHLSQWLASAHQLSEAELNPYFYLHQGEHGIRHTLRVASGLDSMMLGEPQIFGQLKQAYFQACRAGTIKTNLRQLFQYVFSASKRIRSRSGISNNPVSIAYAAVQLIGQIFSDYRPLNVFIIGSGETATLVVKYLEAEGVNQFMIASRGSENSHELTKRVSAISLTIGDIPAYLSSADVVISATSCPLPFITQSIVSHALKQRDFQPMFFLDLAVPRDIEANVSELEGVHLYNIDDLQQIIDKGMDARRTCALKAEQLIESELDNYIRWHRSLKAKSIICNYRTQMQEVAHLEIQRAKKKLSAGSAIDEVLDELGHRLVKKLTHAPTVGLRRAAIENSQAVLDLAHTLLDHEKVN